MVTKTLPLALRILVRITVLAICVGLLPTTTIRAQAATFTVQNGLIMLSNAYYEIAFSTTNGGIAYILEKFTSQKIIDGSKDGSLWAATLDHGAPVSASTSRNTAGSQFSYTWDAAANKLSLTTTGSVAATVMVFVSDAQWLKMQATITNNTGANVSNFSFPNGLEVTASDISDALLPMLPGALINPTFFAKGGVFVNEYPGVMFADYLALRSARGKIALYSQRGAEVQPVLIGYENAGPGSPYSQMTHNYRTWIATTKTWSTPWIVIRVGQDYPATISGYRTDNGIDKFKSLTAKLGKAAPSYFAAPLYKLDLAAIHQPFSGLKGSVIDKLNVPGIIHFVVVQRGGNDKTYPDFIPPDPRWGTTQDFADLVRDIHSKGGLVVPYTNFSWWDNNGPTLRNLPAGMSLPAVVAASTEGSIDIEKYGPNVGVVMNLHNAFVQNKIAQQHDALMKSVGVDGIFEDQWGVRNTPYDFNPAGLETYDPATSYFGGVLDHYRRHASDNLMTEAGIDVLADDGVGFMGTNYLWDILGYRGATSTVTTYYPMAGMLLRDKVLLYQHNLAAETWTKNKDMLRWNLAQGYGLSNAFYDPSLSGFNIDNPWLNLIGVFQKYALSNYADELVGSYDDLGNGVKRTAFTTYTVYSNWNTDQPYEINGDTLPPGGVVTFAKDGSVTAGVFTSYNGGTLSGADHYLVEVRSSTDIKVFQPVGADTPIRVKMLSGATARVVAYKYDGSPVTPVKADVAGDMITFNYASSVNGQPVGYYRIAAADDQTF